MFQLAVICALLVTCGLGSPASWRKPRLLDGRIVGGVDAKIEDHPYQLSFQQYGQHFCGAAMISSKWAITAAHCIGSSTKYYRVSAGSSNKSNGTQYAIASMIRHPKFDSYAIDFDLALLELDSDVEFHETVQPVSLPDSEVEAGTIVNVTGWGALRQGGSAARSLQRVSVQIVPRDLCAKAYKQFNVITQRMICAGDMAEGGKDSCQGDSGGPLVADGILYGIVSWGYGCAKPGFPGVYTNVADFREWIRGETGI
ncbi:trypsin-1-like [Neodiprion fabricii]|uniref:trypsin-1-like n=1 Tax=Neodiprion fabricii TaxID=2872261 RepID=UPI001ED92F8A|nr:trypsin-1-like [Neodiprion fabricii]